MYLYCWGLSWRDGLKSCLEGEVGIVNICETCGVFGLEEGSCWDKYPSCPSSLACA